MYEKSYRYLSIPHIAWQCSKYSEWDRVDEKKMLNFCKLRHCLLVVATAPGPPLITLGLHPFFLDI